MSVMNKELSGREITKRCPLGPTWERDEGNAALKISAISDADRFISSCDPFLGVDNVEAYYEEVRVR